MSLAEFCRRLIPPPLRPDVPIVPVVRLSGTIGVATPLRPGLMMTSIARTLDRAFAVKGARAVALLINSPGGSPAQSHLIYGRIRQLAEEKKLPVYAFVEDVGASGGYMLACAGDEIICDPYAIVGSIGVIGGSFGFVEAMQKLGIERRVYTSGERKAMLDPFLPEKPDDVERIHALQTDIHAHFIALVKARRGARLNGSDDTLFSGEFWVADRAIELGLADRIGDLRSEMRKSYGEKVKLKLIEAERSWIGRQLPGVLSGAQMDASPDALISAVEARAMWSRLGL
jgi:signal peptide peptidase SppA